MSVSPPAAGGRVSPAAGHNTPTEPPASPTPSRFHFLSYVLGLLTALTLVGGSVYFLRRPDPPPIQLRPPPTPAPTATPLPTSTPGPIVIFVSGAVRQPGLYTLPAMARIGDAIAAAGGLASSASDALVNQAQPLYDGAQVHIPFVDSTATEPVEPPPGLSGNVLAPVTSVIAPAAGGTLGAAGLVDVNTATSVELETLPGIGAAKAAAIIANRPYRTVDDLDRVPGIGAATIDRLRGLVTVE